MKSCKYAVGICIAGDGSVGGGPIPGPGASRDTPRPPYDIASFRQDAPEASGPQLAAWRRPTFCESTLFSRSSVDSRSEEHTSELQSQSNLVCRLLLEKKK